MEKDKIMDLIVKQASALSAGEKTALGITGIPDAWPIETFPYTGQDVPDGFSVMSEEDLQQIRDNNKASYDAWLAALRPIIVQSPPAPTTVIVQALPPFGSKNVMINGLSKSLFARFTGIQYTVNPGSNTLIYTATYPWIKMLGLEIINGQSGDTADLKICDTATGTYSGHPNYMLNQFAYTMNIAPNFYSKMAQFDADLYYGMVIQITYVSVSDVPKTVGINLLMNEVK